MPLSVPRSGNVDGEGGTPDGGVCHVTLVGAGGSVDLPPGYRLRIGMVSPGLQPLWAVCGTWTARSIGLGSASPYLLAAAMASEPSVAELTNDADDNGADDER